MARVSPAQAALVSSALAPAPTAALAQAGVPVTVNGCTLQPPPTVARVGDVFSFNIADWKAAAERYKSGPQDATRYLQFKIGLPVDAAKWTIKQYEKLSNAKLKKTLAILMIQMGQGAGVIKRVTGGIRIGDATFLREHKGFGAPWPPGDIPRNPTDLLRLVNQGNFLVWKELVDGSPGAPVARTDPPFEDGGHAWVLRVGMTGRKVIGVDVATGQAQEQLEAIIKLQRLPLSAFDHIQNALGAVLDVLKSIAAVACKIITNDKLQEVSNYGAAVPNPTVQAAVLAWKGAAQACGYVLPAPKGPPDCGVTAEIAPLPSPDPWWKVHQAWLIGGAALLVGGVGITAYLRQTRT